MKLVTMLSAFILSATLAWSSETPTINLEELPQEVQVEVQRALQEAHRARLAYLEAISRANAAAVQRLERQVTNQTRRGNLEGALASRQAIEAINAGWVKSEVEAETDLLGNRVVGKKEMILQNIVGIWNNSNGQSWTFNEDGTINNSFRNFRGTWSINDENKVVVKMHYDPEEILIMNENNTLLTGTTITLTK